MMKFLVSIGDTEHRVCVDECDGHFIVEIDGARRKIDCQNAGHRDYLSMIIDNKSHFVESAAINVDEGKYYTVINGRRFNVDVLDERLVAARQLDTASAQSGMHTVTSPMPGLILDVRVKVGDRVKAGSPLIIMEAMKMQNELVSEVDGVVREITVQENDTVESLTALIEIEGTA